MSKSQTAPQPAPQPDQTPETVTAQPAADQPQPAPQPELPEYVRQIFDQQQQQIDQLKEALAAKPAATGAAPVAAPEAVTVKQWRVVPAGIGDMTVNIDERTQTYEADVFRQMTTPDPANKNRTPFDDLGISYEVIK